MSPAECLPEELLLQICEFFADSGIDVLAFALASSRLADGARALLKSFVTREQADIRDGFFRSLPLFNFSDVPRYNSPDLSASSLFYFCRNCLTPVARQCDLESDQYHGSLGPAFLARHALNTEISPSHADYPVQYTTGHYRVGDVRCSHCLRVLGRKYLWAEDAANFYKIGKVLMEQTLVEMPVCCSAVASPHVAVASTPATALFGTGGGSGCSRCAWWLRRDVALSILSSTDELRNRQSLQLLHAAFIGGREGGTSERTSLRRRLASLLWGVEEKWRSEMESLSMRLVLLENVEEDEWRKTLKYVDTLKYIDKTLMLQTLVVNYFKVGKTNVKHLFYKLDNKEDRTAVLSALAEVASVQCLDEASQILHELKKDIYVPSDSLANWLVCGGVRSHIAVPNTKLL